MSLFFASSIEIDAKVEKEVTGFFMLKNKELEKLYNDYNLKNQSLTSVFAMAVLVTIFSIPLLTLVSKFWVHCDTLFDLVNWFILAAYFLGITLNCWKTYFSHRSLVESNDGQLSDESKRYLHTFQLYLYGSLQVICCYLMLVKVAKGHCDEDAHLSNNLNCNPMDHSKSIPIETSALIMMLPLVYSVSVRGAHFSFVVGLWLLGCSTLTLATIIAEATNSILFVIFYLCTSILVIVEARRLNFYLFFTTMRLQETLEERQREAEEENASEMRYLIANIAHDMKTVSTSPI